VSLGDPVSLREHVLRNSHIAVAPEIQ
jgi:hypothetical protein